MSIRCDGWCPSHPDSSQFHIECTTTGQGTVWYKSTKLFDFVSRAATGYTDDVLRKWVFDQCNRLRPDNKDITSPCYPDFLYFRSPIQLPVELTSKGWLVARLDEDTATLLGWGPINPDGLIPQFSVDLKHGTAEGNLPRSYIYSCFIDDLVSHIRESVRLSIDYPYIPPHLLLPFTALAPHHWVTVSIDLNGCREGIRVHIHITKEELETIGEQIYGQLKT